MFVWGVIPNLLVGNTVVYKASEECILTEKLIADIMAESALPKGVFRAIHGSGTQGELLVNQDIDLIWFTGSSAVGKKLYQVAANKFIKAVLEMGGSNPVVVFADADLDLAAKAITAKRCMFTGQTCDADKRLIVEKSIADSLLQKLADSFSELKVGDPQNPDNYMGPLAAKRQLTLLQSQVKDALDKGAKMYYQQTLNKSHQGAYYPPTILTHIKPTMRVWREEVFGPVLPVVTFTSEAEGIELANDTQYGLGSQLFTSDAARANRVARHIEAGNVDVNGVGHFKACNSFGGYKQSGLGREHGIHGLQELCQIKVVAKSK
jgi:acyl-CoA reductase-like NAD-dependent aldehyde dehydrogenase